jgi:hypothetical protein
MTVVVEAARDGDFIVSITLSGGDLFECSATRGDVLAIHGWGPSIDDFDC